MMIKPYKVVLICLNSRIDSVFKTKLSIPLEIGALVSFQFRGWQETHGMCAFWAV